MRNSYENCTLSELVEAYQNGRKKYGYSNFTADYLRFKNIFVVAKDKHGVELADFKKMAGFDDSAKDTQITLEHMGKKEPDTMHLDVSGQSEETVQEIIENNVTKENQMTETDQIAGFIAKKSEKNEVVRVRDIVEYFKMDTDEAMTILAHLQKESIIKFEKQGYKICTEEDQKISKSKTTKMMGRVMALLYEEKKPLDAAEIAERLGVKRPNVWDACHRLKKAGYIEPIGKKPWHYLPSKNKPWHFSSKNKSEITPKRKTSEKLMGKRANRIAEVLEKRPLLTLAGLSDRLRLDRQRVSEVLYLMEKREQVEKIGKEKPYRYRLVEKQKDKKDKRPYKSKRRSKSRVSEKVYNFLSKQNKPVCRADIAKHMKFEGQQISAGLANLKKQKAIRVVMKKNGTFYYEIIPVVSEPRIEEELIPAPAQDVKSRSPILDKYIIAYATQNSNKPQFLYNFADTADFINQFSGLQDRDDIVELHAFKLMQLNKKVVYVPEL